LAEELSKKIESDENLKLPEISDPSQLFGMLFGGKDKSNSLNNIMSTICSELDTKITDGSINQNQLLQEAQQLLGGLNMFGDMSNMSNMSNNKKKV